jgi:hypothetical protein
MEETRDALIRILAICLPSLQFIVRIALRRAVSASRFMERRVHSRCIPSCAHHPFAFSPAAFRGEGLIERSREAAAVAAAYNIIKALASKSGA